MASRNIVTKKTIRDQLCSSLMYFMAVKKSKKRSDVVVCSCFKDSAFKTI